MVSIFDAPIPSQRWALPSDTTWDKYEDFYDQWLDEHYDFEKNEIFGMKMSQEEAFESEEVRDIYLDIMVTDAAEARAERMMEDY